jgi:glycosyltransferase involved in cell wall biosynthesis
MSRRVARHSVVEVWRRLMTRGVTALEKAALRRADVIITLNDTRRREAEGIAGDGPHFATVHVGVDTNRFAPGPDASDGYLLTVGRLDDSRKNVPLLLRAYAAARARSASLPRLVLAGHTPPDRACWQLMAALGLRDHVEFRGPLDRDQLAALYRGASAFVLSSDEEGQGIVVLEAMASGLPIVTTACIGPEELVSDGIEGFVVPVRSIGPLADALVRLSENVTLRQRLSAAARTRAVRRFSLDAAGARLCEVYRAAGLVPEVQWSAGAAPAGAPCQPNAVATSA